MSATAVIKSGYVKGVRLIDAVVHRLGADSFFTKRLDRRPIHWFYSLLAIHHLDRMIALDVPWWTYTAIDHVEAFLARQSNPRVFEYGSGASTVWLAKRSAEVISVEHDDQWYQTLSPRLMAMPHVAYHLVPPTADGDETDLDEAGDYRSKKHDHAGLCFREYAASLDKDDGLFDLIVIDGRARHACLRHAIPKLAPGGLIVFDNSWRRRYRAGIRRSNLEPLVCTGMAPALPVPDQTTLLYRKSEISLPLAG
ncbi:MAG: class I SAM-dependent methyltransferase [Pseudomonadota bacterium]